MTEGDERGPEQIRADIEQTREQLGETVAELAEKADVKAQARGKVEDVKQTVLDKRDELVARGKDNAPESASQGVEQLKARVQANPLPYAVGAALVAGFAFGRARSR